MHLVRVGDKDAVSCADTDTSVAKVTGYLVINFTTIPYQLDCDQPLIFLCKVTARET